MIYRNITIKVSLMQFFFEKTRKINSFRGIPMLTNLVLNV